jgi:adenine-specific DNA-methyltransferase
MESEKSRKLRGGYYTPKSITEFISRWAIRDKDDIVLEPSCGDGTFIDSIFSRLLELEADKPSLSSQVYLIEHDPLEAKKAISRFKGYGIKASNSRFFVGDFFEYCTTHLSGNVNFDCIVGNPPFIRYQDFPEEQRALAFSLMAKAGLKPNRLTNIWIPFLIASTLLLKENGRIGMVIPAELFQVNYASETRRFLSEMYNNLLIITFRKLIFPDVQQEVILLLGEKNSKSHHGIKVIEIDSLADIAEVDIRLQHSSIKTLNHTTDKWTQYFLENHEIDLLRKLKTNPAIPLVGEYVNVDVGVVTGQNQYFVLSQETVREFKLEKHVKRIIGRANHIKGAILRESDWQCLSDAQLPVYLLNAPDVDYCDLPSVIRKYIDHGESKDCHVGYKCKIRKRWWVVPSSWIPDVFMLRQVHSYPKMVANNSMATTTDTLHRVKLTNGLPSNVIASTFVNSLTLAFSEITGRSYGGGVLTFEPSEAEMLPLPVKNAKKLDIEKIDILFRANDVDSVLDLTDKILLRDGLNFTRKDIIILRNIWKKLRDRRINRRAVSAMTNKQVNLLTIS